VERLAVYLELARFYARLAKGEIAPEKRELLLHISAQLRQLAKDREIMLKENHP
jgi:hypothetical protein